MSRAYDVAVVGGGPWGIALARTAARAGSRVVLVSRREIEEESAAAGSLVVRPDVIAASEASLLILAVPSPHVTVFADELAPHLDGAHFVIHGVRGLVGEELLSVSDVFRARTPVRRLGALGGPTLVPELEAGTPSVIVVGSAFPEVVEAFRESFASRSLRVYATSDLTGLEWASAVNGAYLIALGYALVSGAGPGLVAAFTTWRCTSWRGSPRPRAASGTRCWASPGSAICSRASTRRAVPRSSSARRSRRART